jgi:DMSO/TMAO reductase YedYZ molybdopterin-dependent catalytic subunit
VTKPAIRETDHKRGMIVRQTAPLNLETPFAQLSDWIVPVEEFFVRNHFPVPTPDPAEWRLVIGGLVERPLSLSLADLAAMPQIEMPAVVECAGNGRVYYEPVRQGLQWQNGAVGNARWSGVRLADLLTAAGVRPGAVEAVLVGADGGLVDGGQKTASPGPIAFARSIPLDKAMADDVILATHMNGEPLRQEHGFPLRAVIGGWYGMAWIKWLAEIRIVDRPFGGYWQMRDYFRWSRDLGEPRLTPLSVMEVKSQIIEPITGARLRLGEPVRIRGMAWSGHGGIERVDLSFDGGGWKAARLLGEDLPNAWRGFEHFLTPVQPGKMEIRARATDRRDNVQPETQQSDRESYLANWIVPVTVSVVAGADKAGAEYAI